MEQILFFGAMAAIYLIPSFLASGKRGSDGIIALNIILGWTFIGWVAALIWALTAQNKPLKKVPLNYDTKISYCAYCKADTKTIYPRAGDYTNVPLCAECGGVKD